MFEEEIVIATQGGHGGPPLQGPRRIDLAVFEYVNFAAGKEDAVASTCWCEVYTQTAGHRHRLVQGFDLGGPIRLKVCCLLHERGGLVARFSVLLLHGRDQFISIRNFRV
jgi:hypothetical protein